MTEADPKEPGQHGKLWRPILLVCLVVALMILSKMFDLGSKLSAVQDWVNSSGKWGPAVFVAVYVFATILAVPGTVLTLGAGALFGSVLGVILVSIGSTIGASACFVIARYFARGAISGWLEGNEKFTRLDKMTAQQGAAIVAITRLVPLFPFNLLNYGFGLTNVRLGTYVLWSWLFMLPGTVLYVVGADALSKAVSEGRIPWTLVIVMVVVAVILGIVVKKAKKRLDQKETLE